MPNPAHGWRERWGTAALAAEFSLCLASESTGGAAEGRIRFRSIDLVKFGEFGNLGQVVDRLGVLATVGCHAADARLLSARSGLA